MLTLDGSGDADGPTAASATPARCSCGGSTGESGVLASGPLGRSAPIHPARTCCLSLFEVSAQDRRRHRARCRSTPEADAAETDAGGRRRWRWTDELVRQRWSPDGGTAEVEVLRWDGACLPVEFVDAADAPHCAALGRATRTATRATTSSLGPSLPATCPLGSAGVAAWLASRGPMSHLGERFEGWIAGIVDKAFVVIARRASCASCAGRAASQPRSRRARFAGRCTRSRASSDGDGRRADRGAWTRARPWWVIAEPLTLYDLALRRAWRGRGRARWIACSPTCLSGPGASSAELAAIPMTRTSGRCLAGDADRSDGFAWNGRLVTADRAAAFETRPIAPHGRPASRSAASVRTRAGWRSQQRVLRTGGTTWRTSSAARRPIGARAGSRSSRRRPDGAQERRAAPAVELRGAVSVGEPEDDVTELLAPADGFEVGVTAPSGQLGRGVGRTGRRGGAIDGRRDHPRSAPPTVGGRRESAARRRGDRRHAGRPHHVRSVDRHIRAASRPSSTVAGRTETFASAHARGRGRRAACDRRRWTAAPSRSIVTARFDVSVDAGPWPHGRRRDRARSGRQRDDRARRGGRPVDYRGLAVGRARRSSPRWARGRCSSCGSRGVERRPPARSSATGGSRSSTRSTSSTGPASSERRQRGDGRNCYAVGRGRPAGRPFDSEVSRSMSSRIDELDAIVRQFDLNQHPFYTEWRAGTLPIERLAEYADEWAPFIGAVDAGWEPHRLPGVRRRGARARRAVEPLPRRADATGEMHRPQSKTLLAVGENAFASVPEALGALYSFEVQQPATASSQAGGPARALRRHRRRRCAAVLRRARGRDR